MRKIIVSGFVFGLFFLSASYTLALADLKAVSADICYRTKPVFYYNYVSGRTAVEADWKIRLATKNIGNEASLPAWVSLSTALMNMFKGQVSSVNLVNPMIPALQPGQSTITIWNYHLLFDRDYPWKGLFIFPNKMNEPDVANNSVYFNRYTWMNPCP